MLKTLALYQREIRKEVKLKVKKCKTIYQVLSRKPQSPYKQPCSLLLFSFDVDFGVKRKQGTEIWLPLLFIERHCKFSKKP